VRGTPYTHVAQRMKDAPEARIRARCAQIGFPNVKADTRIELLSGGEKARLLMGLATFDGPHLIIMDEPTNHLDIDSRAALIEAINQYEGAIILVSHDRHLLEACADRLWLVAEGSVKSFDGDMDDYRRFVLDQASGGDNGRKGTGGAQAEQRREAAKTRKELAPLKKKIEAAEERMKKFEGLLRRVDEALAQPDAFTRDPGKAAQLAQQRAELERAIAAAEDEWLTLSAEYEDAAG
jgi:ATP-binding cassette, subfamily F, member 3